MQSCISGSCRHGCTGRCYSLSSKHCLCSFSVGPETLQLPTSDFNGAGDPAHNSLEANVGQLQGVRPVPNPPGPIVGITVNAIWQKDNLESADSNPTLKAMPLLNQCSGASLLLTEHSCCERMYKHSCCERMYKLTMWYTALL